MGDSSSTILSAQRAELARLKAEAAEAKALAAQARLEAARLNAQAAQPASTPPRVAATSPATVRAPVAEPAASKPAGAPLRRRLFTRAAFRTLGSWSTSMLFHMAILVVLATWMLPGALKPELPMLTALAERDDDELNQVLDRQTDASVELAVASSAFSGLPSGHASTMEVSAAAPAFDRQVSEDAAGPKVAIGDVDFASVQGKALSLDVPEGAPGDAQAVVDDYQEAMDRITQEILMMLMKNKVLVVWLFDESESMKDDQAQITRRIERVYEELGLIKATEGDALLTSVCSFGEKWHLHTAKPTFDIEEIKAAIGKVPVDESGKEMLCQSVGETVTQYRKFAQQGRRQLAVIVVSDESGDPKTNVDYLEPAIAEAKAARARIYVLGREAVFGYPYAQMRWIDAKTKIPYWLQIDRGPETPAVEQLQTNGFYRRFDAHPSGFGPYEQVRMCRETGGIFFQLPSPEVNLVHRDDRKYQLAAMRPYMPDLSSRDEYVRDRDAVEMRRELYEVVEKLNPYNPVAAPHIVMRHHFSIDPAEFAKQVRAEEEKAKNYIVYLDAREKELEALKTKRDNESYPRWRANYDLVYAQVIAYKVRMYEYGVYLDDFIEHPKPVKNPLGKGQKTTHWDLTTRRKTLTDETTSGYVQKSKELFAAVVKDHAGTPWAARAEWELKRGFGVELVEDYVDPRRGQNVKLPKL